MGTLCGREGVGEWRGEGVGGVGAWEERGSGGVGTCITTTEQVHTFRDTCVMTET